MTITIGKLSGKLKKYKYHVSDVPCLNLNSEFVGVIESAA
jgi:hypothetical protein